MALHLTEADYHKLAAQYGWTWIGDTVPLIKHKTLWRCPKGHVLERSYQTTKVLGLRCTICNLIDRAYKLAVKKNVYYIDIEPCTLQTVLRWRCEKGHTFERSLVSLQHGKHACPVCIGLYPKTKEDYQALADSIGYMWLDDTLPENILCPTIWQCDQGHLWRARYNQIQSGKRCPHP